MLYRILKHALTLSTPSPGIGGGMGLDVPMEAKTEKKSTTVEDGENIIFFNQSCSDVWADDGRREMINE